MAKSFNELVKEKGSVAAALSSQGYTQTGSNTWSAGSGSSGSGSSGVSGSGSSGSSGGTRTSGNAGSGAASSGAGQTDIGTAISVTRSASQGGQPAYNFSVYDPDTGYSSYTRDSLGGSSTGAASPLAGYGGTGTQPTGAAAGLSGYVPLDQYNPAALYTRNAQQRTPAELADAEARLKQCGVSYNQHMAASRQCAANGDAAGAAYYKGLAEQDHLDAESIRSWAGYSGGVDGSQYNSLGQWMGGSGTLGQTQTQYPVHTYPEEEEALLTSLLQQQPFTYGQEPVYNDQTRGQIDAQLSALMNRSPFSYDYTQDPLYLQYAESYMRNGKRAMEDTLGQMAARTGGLASSYAESAAQQTQDQYAAALADKIPELEQLAYGMYLDEGNTMRQNLAALMDLENLDFNQYLSALNQFNTDRAFDYGVYADDRDSRYNTWRALAGDNQWQQSFNYNAYRDGVADSQWQQSFNYNAGRDSLADELYEQEYRDKRSDTEYDRLWAVAQDLAQYGDFSGFKALGYSDEQIAGKKAAYDAAMLLEQQAAAAKRSSGGGSSRSSGGGSSSSSGSGGEVDLEGLYAYAYQNGGFDAIKQKSVYSQFGLTSAPTQSGYNRWVDELKNNGLYRENASELENLIRHISPSAKDVQIAQIGEKIRSSFLDGVISESEADYLLSLLGA